MAGLMRDAGAGRLVHGSPGLHHSEARSPPFPFPVPLPPSLTSSLSASFRASLRSRQAVGAFLVAAVLALAALSHLNDVGYTRGAPPRVQPVNAGGEGGAPGSGDRPLGIDTSTAAVAAAGGAQGGGEGASLVAQEAAKNEAPVNTEAAQNEAAPEQTDGVKSGAPGHTEAITKSEAPGRAEGVGSEEGEGPDPSRASKCPEGCSDNGTCNEETGECYCVPSQEGPTCADNALPRCQLAPGYALPCYMRYHLSTCECTQDCQKYRLPVGGECLRGTLPDGSLNPNLTDIYEGRFFRVRWHSHDTEVSVPDYNVEQGEEQRESLSVSPLECPEMCGGRGICNRQFKQCECPWLVSGPTCQETFRQSGFAPPSSACLNECSGKGRCAFGTCRCDRGYFGIDCSLYIDKEGKTRLVRLAPYKWAGLPVRPRDAPPLRPRVYVYDLPGYFNTWQGVHTNAMDWEEPVWFLERLLNSPYRTPDPNQADFFYIPLFLRNRNDNKQNVVTFAKEYIRKRWPHFDRSGGSNHIVLTNSDWGNCQLGGPGGHAGMSAVLDDLMTLTLWGMSKNMTLGEDHPCFRPGRDIVIPPIMTPEVYRLAPDILSEEADPPEEERPILCYFRGSSYVDAVEIPGQYMMSLGVRQAMFGNFSGSFQRTGILLEGMGDPAPEPDWYLRQMRKSLFCLAAAGYGWAMRTTQAVIMGCIPLVIMPDVYQPFEGDGLKWEEFSVRVKNEDIPKLETILRSYSREQIRGFQRAMWGVRRRFMWSSTNLNPFSRGGVGEFTPEEVEKGAQQIEGTDAFVTVMDALRLRIKT